MRVLGESIIGVFMTRGGFLFRQEDLTRRRVDSSRHNTHTSLKTHNSPQDSRSFCLAVAHDVLKDVKEMKDVVMVVLSARICWRYTRWLLNHDDYHCIISSRWHCRCYTRDIRLNLKTAMKSLTLAVKDSRSGIWQSWS